MKDIYDKKIKDIDTKKEVELILERYEEAKDGKVKSIDDFIKNFIIDRELWKNLV